MTDLAQEREKAKAQSPEALAALEGTISATKLTLAKNIAPYRKLLGMVFGNELSAEQVAAIADQYVEKGEFTIGEKKYNRDSLSQIVKQKIPSGAKVAGLAKAFGIKMPSSDVSAMVPSQEDLTLPAKRIAEATAENTGFLSKIWFAIAGFFQWMLGGFKGNLMDSIREVGANSIVDSARVKLQQDMEQRPQLAVALKGRQGLEETLGVLHEKIMKQGSEGAATGPTQRDIAAAVKAIPPVSIVDMAKLDTPEMKEALKNNVDNAKKMVSDLVQNQVMEFLKPGQNKELWNRLYEENKDKAWFYERWAVSTGMADGGEKVREKVTEVVSPNRKLLGDAVADATLAAFKELTPDQVKEYVKNPASAEAFSGTIIAKLKESEKWKEFSDKLKAKAKNIPAEKLLEPLKEKIGSLIKENAGILKDIPPDILKELPKLQKALQDNKLASHQPARDQTIADLASAAPLGGVLPNVRDYGSGKLKLSPLQPSPAGKMQNEAPLLTA